ncbi:SCP-like protein [Ancylostoma ceylanicum]|uniref:SCP-like protein n=1 Tax=Ancylostoma ceylanicum TaxID=53326 RepID=A0A0D6M736_9BILA|nr:SCP-like protein [Ancylostoma ceylanicum]
MRLILALLVAITAIVAAESFGCRKDLEIDDNIRKLFLDFHNEKRIQLAKGEVKGFKPAKNMYKLSWSCELEYKAQQHIKDCPSSLGDFGSYGANNRIYTARIQGGRGRISAAEAFPNPKTQITDTLKAWWSPVQNNRLDRENRYPKNTQLYNAAKIIHAATTQVGCTYHICTRGIESKMEIFCLYDEVASMTGQPVYDTGSLCGKDDDCTTYRKSTCDKKTKLCVKPPEEPETQESKMCDRQNGLTDKTRRAIVDLHNYFRSRVARGKAEDKLSKTKFAPTAKNMLKMEYKCDLEKTAADYARRCEYKHSQLHERNNAGENLYMVTIPNAEKTKTGEWATRGWFSELKDFGVGSSNLLTQQLWYRKSPDPNIHIQIGHYTQMVWGKTKEIGCGIQHCPHKRMTLAVCHYRPA